MSGFKQCGTVGGGILLAATAGLIAMAEDASLQGPDPAAVEQPLFIAPPPPAPAAATAESGTFSQNTPMYCPQCQPCQPGHFARFKERCRAKYWGYPEKFCEPPLGTMLMGHNMTQVANGQAARMALYQYDFVPGSDQLNARGKAQLAKIAQWLPTNAFPVFVEPTPARPKLDEARRQVVWHEIASQHFSIPSERVLVGRPNVRGLDASDALAIDRNRTGLTTSRGSASSSGGTSTSSSDTSGTTGSTGSTGSTGQSY